MSHKDKTGRPLKANDWVDVHNPYYQTNKVMQIMYLIDGKSEHCAMFSQTGPVYIPAGTLQYISPEERFKRTLKGAK